MPPVQTVTAEYTRVAPLRQALGAVVVACVALPLVVVALCAFVVATEVVQILTGNFKSPRVRLLEMVPGLAMLAGIASGATTHPVLVVRKLWHLCCGRKLGTPRPATGGPRAVSRLEVLRINGADHVVRVRGADVTKPVLLFLHGGPGMTEMLGGAGAVCRTDLEADFVVVDYDQRSACCSGVLNWGRVPNLAATLTVEQHVLDAAALAEWLCEGTDLGMPPRDKVHVAGGSWGSVLALRTAARAPHLFHAPVVVRGMVTLQAESERIGYDYLLRTIRTMKAPSARDTAALENLRGVPPGSFAYTGKEGVAQMLEQRRYLRAYGGDKWSVAQEVARQRQPEPEWKYMAGMVRDGVAAPEVSLAALLTTKANVTRTIEVFQDVLWRPGTTIQPAHVDVSFVVAQGVQDHCTASSLVEDYVRDRISVGGGCTKRIAWFAKSGHAPCKEEPDEFAALLRDVWLAPQPTPRCSYALKEL